MLVNIKTTISFDTIKEKEAIERFIAENNLEEWREQVFTTSTVFINDKTFYSVGAHGLFFQNDIRGEE